MHAVSRPHLQLAGDGCDACHAADVGGHVYPLRLAGDDLCRSCHLDISTYGPEHQHAPQVRCTSCHTPHDTSGPALLKQATIAQTCASCHQVDQTDGLAGPHASQACTTCHAVHPDRALAETPNKQSEASCRTCHNAQAASVATSPHHPQNVKQSCLACHRVHGSSKKAILSAEPRELCLTCHATIAQAAAGRTTHDAVLKDRQCLSCHDAHAARHPAMLRDQQATVCATCHDQPQHATDGRQIPAMPAGQYDAAYVHGPVAAGDCAACHTVHGGNEARLLKRVEPAALPSDTDRRNFSLCFLCHDSLLLLDASADTTLFRNGAANLHRRHLLSGDRTRSCSACHVAHAGNRPKLIAEMVSFQGSNWKMPLKFTQTDSGGRCAPGCHEPMEYRRERSARPPNIGGAP